MSLFLKKVTCGVANIASLCGVFFNTPPRALVRALHLNLFEKQIKVIV
jgi:hypothetical protein